MYTQEQTPNPSFTPGPWMYLGGDRGIYTKLNDGCRGSVVASIPVCIPENEANAQLIAAAPAMYEALVKAEAAMKTFGWGKSTWFPFLAEVAADVEKALAAARKGGAA